MCVLELKIEDFMKSLTSSQKAFTLAEVLITLGILGILAAMTIGILQNITDNGFKVAYKKAYSDMSQAFEQALQEQSLTPRLQDNDDDATASEWTIMKQSFKVNKDCTLSQLNDCWAGGDKLWGNTLPNTTHSNSFVDASGRSWAEYSSYQNIYLVDTNGFKLPNQFGKDRWIFDLENSNGRVTSGLPTRVKIFYHGDLLSSSDSTQLAKWCQYPPCYYYSWLYN